MSVKDLMEMIQDNLLVAFDHLTDEEKTVMCQIVVDTINDNSCELTKDDVGGTNDLYSRS